MLRVLLRVDEVSIRVREHAEVQICVRKNNYGFTMPKKAVLKEGFALLNGHLQFFITSQDPTFQINVMLIWDSMKKLAGTCTIDLNDWEQSSNNQTSVLLQRSLDNKASITFNFLYLTTDIPLHRNKIITSNVLQAEKNSSYLKEIKTLNQNLLNQNESLTKQLSSLKKINQQLEHNKDLLTAKYEQSQSFFESKMKKMNEEKEESQEGMKRMKIKMNKMMDAVRNSNEDVLVKKIQSLMSEQ